VKTLVIIPTYNELENIARLFEGLGRAYSEAPWAFDVLVVDDNSPDGTAAAVKALQASADRPRIRLLEREGKGGLASAYLAGFELAKREGYEAVVEMDADLSHDPGQLPAILTALADHDFAIGSRYVAGGGVTGWGALRRFMSRGGGLFSQIILGCPIRDLTGGYNAWRMTALDAIGLGLIISKGYSFQVELKYRALRKGRSYMEVPIIFADRTHGKSKMSKEIFFEAIKNVIVLRKSVG
jgi:dolichol-phosphate mannosyltransferase